METISLSWHRNFTFPDFLNVNKTILILFALVFLHVTSFADEVRFTLMVSSQKISLQDYLQVQFTIENSKKVSQFVPPPFKNFNVMEGPDQASGWSLQDGVLKEYISFSYLLKAIRPGRILIPSATVKIDGKTYRSNNAWVDVINAVYPGQTEDRSVMNEFIMKKGESLQKKISNNIFVKLDVNKKTCFEGEPLVATYKLYTRLKSESKVTKRPSFNGFSVYDMVDPEREESGREIYNGKEYNVYLLRKVQLYPLQSGSFELDAVEVENNLTFVKEESMGSDYGLSGLLQSLADHNGNQDGIIRETVTLTSNPVKVEVKPLPQNAAPMFNGAVGQFHINTRIAGGKIHKNDVVDVQVEISGKGNFPVLAPPSVQWPDSLEAYESTVKEQFNKFVSPISGAKIFTYPLSVRREGDIVIPPVSLYYFDPETGKYGIASSDSVKFHVDPALAATAVKTTLPLKTEATGDIWKWIISGIGLLTVFGGLYLILRQNHNVNVVPDKSPLRQVATAADQQLQPETKEEDLLRQIKMAFEQGDYHLFYKQVNNVINEWMQKKYGANASGNWENTLQMAGVDSELIRQIAALKKDAAMAIYTPFIMDRKMIEDLESLQKIIA